MRSTPPQVGTVLLVEDDFDQRESLVHILESEGYLVACAEHGQQALDQLRQGLCPCLILLDLRMPVMDGWEFRKRQQQDPALASIPVVVMTGVADTEEQARTIDAVFYFTKPYKVAELLATVARYCG